MIFRCFYPLCSIEEGTVVTLLRQDEIELLKLIDLEGLQQDEAASAFGVSRKTVWRDLHEARRKIADALVNGRPIEVAGCVRRDTEGCPKQESIPCLKTSGGKCPRVNCPYSAGKSGDDPAGQKQWEEDSSQD